jgi:hypothetical protein
MEDQTLAPMRSGYGRLKLMVLMCIPLMLLLGISKGHDKTNDTPVPQTLGDLLRPQYRQMGAEVPVSWWRDTVKIGEHCTWESKSLVIQGHNLLKGVLDSAYFFNQMVFDAACTQFEDTTSMPRKAYFTVDSGRIDDQLISLSIHNSTMYSEKKAEVSVNTVLFDPSSRRFLLLPQLFTLKSSALYPLLRRLVLQQIALEHIFYDPEDILFDGGKQSTQEVLSAFMVTQEALIFFFGKEQCLAFPSSLAFSISLPWVTPI